MKLIEVKVLEPASNELWEEHPARWRYVNCWENSDGSLTPVGGEGVWHFDENKQCSNFWSGEKLCQAWIVGEINRDRYLEADK